VVDRRRAGERFRVRKKERKNKQTGKEVFFSFFSLSLSSLSLLPSFCLLSIAALGNLQTIKEEEETKRK
jgi:hypothetical protein